MTVLVWWAPTKILKSARHKSCRRKVVGATDCLTVHYGFMEGPIQNFTIDPKLWTMLTQNNESATFKFDKEIWHGKLSRTYHHSAGSVKTILKYSRDGDYAELNGYLTHESGREFRIENCGKHCHALVNMTHGEC